MLKRRLFILFSFLLTALSSLSQEVAYGPGYRTILAFNPAFSGAGGTAVLNLSYLNFYPGNNFDLHTFYASFDSYYETLHGGIGAWISNDYNGGILNDTRGGISYAYSLQAGEDLFINAGLSAALFHRGMNFSGAVLPDMIDPVRGVSMPSGENLVPSTVTVFDVGAGFLLMYRNFFSGFSVNHLSQPDISAGSGIQRLRRKAYLNAAIRIPLNESRNFNLIPASFVEFSTNSISAGAGASFESNILALNALLLTPGSGNLDAQAGFSVKTGKLGIFYSYRFNILSGNRLTPFSLLHNTGISIGLNSVDKRKGSKTITLPEL
jgi:type IX secretion system PorP/SprF family membrane protein